jgi:hypothetical protein
MEKDIFEAARSGDIAAVEAHITRGADLSAKNPYGFTALHCAAMGCNTVDEERAFAIIKSLLKAGSPIDLPSKDGRTALFLAAEFSRTLGPVKLLIESGAKADIRSAHGIHVVTNAMTEVVRQFLSDLTGHPVPPPRVEFPSVKMNASEWRQARLRIDEVFAELSQTGLITLHDAGTTQEDGFSDCSEEFHARDGKTAGLLGFCFYTRQDLNRAKRTSQLSLAFWGAPDGAPEPMCRVGQMVVDAFRKKGFAVNWNGAPSMRPTVLLK